ncbi:hypothetical protein [Undibacterium baiyunense]|uniref:Uncharacterized protein n=1 Tax=Undibacterium baiyunense TaxID=2828731 RepID=A0A941DHW0_9BURK|nr:hypothetical protein [Undibacterium baiyunense]MBR7748375.1 hypothetical protein [Undibacterium baiyunense]
MKTEAANEIMERLASLSATGNELREIIESFDDIEERKEFRRVMGNIMVAHSDLMRLIIRQFPSLDPDRDTDWHKEIEQRRNDKP